MRRPSPRYSPTPLPPYRYVPGKAPHPTRDPQGHSHGRREPALPRHWASDWNHCDAYLYGVDLFNSRYWWEAHESWERCWVASGRDGVDGQFLQGLIQVAVACLKYEQGRTGVAVRLAAEGFSRMPRNQPLHLGIDVPTLRALTLAHVEGGNPAAPVIDLVFATDDSDG